MSISLCDWGIDEEEFFCRPNPYQAEAEAQILAGEWPGNSVLSQFQGHKVCYTQDEQHAQKASPADRPQQFGKGKRQRRRQSFSNRAGLAAVTVVQEELAGDTAAAEGKDPSQAEIQAEPQAEVFSDNGIEGEEIPSGRWSFLHEFRIPVMPCGLGLDSPDEGDVDTGAPETGPDTTATEGDEESHSPWRAYGFDSDACRGHTLSCSAASSRPEVLGVGIEEQDLEEESDQNALESAELTRVSHKQGHATVPKRTDLGKKYGDPQQDDIEITTIMIRNIPNLYTRNMLMDELDSLGFYGEYDFIYLPMDKSTTWNIGYAFVNFVAPEVAARCRKKLNNYIFCKFENPSGKVAQCSVAHIQGLKKNVDHYSHTAVQCARMKEHRPMVLPTKSFDTAAAHRRRRRQGRSRGLQQLTEADEVQEKQDDIRAAAQAPLLIRGCGVLEMVA
eukprot:gnl/TRDRNA2_/TRDRNA2_71522_c0_seq1.p1 gnl/TRDRNA2_/TRDRNA2_71522_c0~~gnl/TRDRNA2_/TRDRNA2_71522_c0_seq1.p1  ORF type:complete len:446 (-),score=89.88 gnl/TRDRNA2_/TRDRNA2_71522_c0_seq1:64-1401(-)